MKLCAKCLDYKDFDKFRNHRRSKDGKKSYCIDCDDEYQKQRYQQKKALIKETIADWQSKNKEKLKLYRKKWKQRHQKT